MKKCFVTCLVFIFCLLGFVGTANAIYDPLSVPNNKFGIHILETEEAQKASELVGTWGYVTVPIRANDRNLDKWTKFMEDCTKFKIIPILRIASFPVDDHWMAPNEYDLVDFANFLDELPWPIKNRYVIVYNEPNHEGEWGGFVYPEEYARVLDRAVDIFHSRNKDFFVISAGMDASAPNSKKSLNVYDYYDLMNHAWPNAMQKVDGFSFHTYGNPAFATYPNIYSSVNIASYRYELNFLSRLGINIDKPIFLTEAGWKNGGWLDVAFKEVWTEENIIAVTPFLLDAQAGPFADFSFINQNGGLKNFAQEYKNMEKVSASPILGVKKAANNGTINPSWTGSLPRILKTDLIGSYLQAFLNMLMRKK